MKSRIRFAFTLVELLVVIAIIGVMVGVALPAVSASRESTRRTRCTQNVSQLLRALHEYENAREVLPAGSLNKDGPIENVATGQQISWIVQVLPYLDHPNLQKIINVDLGAYADENAEARKMELSQLQCPSFGEWPIEYGSNYAGCHNDVEAPISADNNGVLFLNSAVRLADITDGQSQTIFLGEKLPAADDFGWISGTRSTLRNMSWGIRNTHWGQQLPKDQVGGFGSAHLGDVAVFGLGDGRVRPLSASIAPQVFERLGNRRDGKVISDAALD